MNQREIKVMKNNVSYFQAGFKAAMLIFGSVSAAEIERRFYVTTLYPNMVREALQYYDSCEDDTSGSKKMLDNL